MNQLATYTELARAATTLSNLAKEIIKAERNVETDLSIVRQINIFRNFFFNATMNIINNTSNERARLDYRQKLNAGNQMFSDIIAAVDRDMTQNKEQIRVNRARIIEISQLIQRCVETIRQATRP